jgi:hypothetical protein
MVYYCKKQFVWFPFPFPSWLLSYSCSVRQKNQVPFKILLGYVLRFCSVCLCSRIFLFSFDASITSKICLIVSDRFSSFRVRVEFRWESAGLMAQKIPLHSGAAVFDMGNKIPITIVFLCSPFPMELETKLETPWGIPPKNPSRTKIKSWLSFLHGQFVRHGI